jgi:hypothetical protein
MLLRARLLSPAAACLFLAQTAGAVSVTINSSLPSPVPLGTTIRFAAVAVGAKGGVWYRYRAREVGKDFHVIKDFSPDNTLDWTTILHEGSYEIQVTVRDLSSGETADAVAAYSMQSLVSGDQAVITPTTHPLVFIYSAPACPAGQRMRVRFRGAGGVPRATPFHACDGANSMNFYLAGMQSQTAFTAHQVLDTGSGLQAGPVMDIQTQAASSSFVGQNVVQAAPSAAQNDILLQAPITSSQIATDLSGNVIWYYPGTVSYITRPEPGGRFFAIIENSSAGQSYQLLREFDLAGTTLLETNAARVSEQLVAAGHRPIGAFHHEARRLPDGKILTIASVEQIMNDVQGSGPIDILGDMIIVLDANLQVSWAWDTFDHLDVTRMSTTKDVCPGGCPPLFLASKANDWTHGNAAALTPDGDILFSSRHQDWVIKIDYQNGAGSGAIVWRLGKDGDFTINSSDPSPWFSHQHDPQFLDSSNMILFDNSNLRHLADPTANSRGYVIQLDETNLVATPVLLTDLGAFSMALGAAQKFSNGDLFFLLGWLPTNTTSMSIEVDPSGNTVFALEAQALEYRAFRIPSLYSPN